MASCLLIKQEKLERRSYPRSGGGGGTYNLVYFLFTGTSRPITSSLQYPLPLLPLKNYIFTCMKHPPWKISNKFSMLSIAPKLLQHKSSQHHYHFNLPLKTSAFNYLVLCKKINSNDWINLASAYPVIYINIYINIYLFFNQLGQGETQTNLRKNVK